MPVSLMWSYSCFDPDDREMRGRPVDVVRNQMADGKAGAAWRIVPPRNQRWEVEPVVGRDGVVGLSERDEKPLAQLGEAAGGDFGEESAGDPANIQLDHLPFREVCY